MTIHWNGHDQGLAYGFQDLIEAAVGDTGYDYVVTEGLRTSAYQDALYAQGRTAPGPKVTNAKGGQSAHNFGLGIDIYPMLENGHPDYQDPPKNVGTGAAWQALWAGIRNSGTLTTGADFSTIYDPGHVEFTDWRLFKSTPMPVDVTSTDNAVPVDPTTDTTEGDGTVPSGFSTPAVLAVVAIAGIAFMLYKHRNGG